MRLIALGSSFAAGPGIAPQVDAAAGRSGNNYPHLLARRLGLDSSDSTQLLDLTVSGATMLNLISDDQDTGDKVFPPQISLLPPADDDDQTIITVTGGGNDMFYIGSMFARTLSTTLWGRIYSYLFMTQDQKQGLENPTIASPDQVVERFNILLDDLHERFPRATVYLVEYFAMMGPETVGGKHVAWSQVQVETYKQTANQLKRIYAQAAEGRENVHIVPLAQASYEHAIGSKHPWVSDGSILNFYRGGAFHPNLAGMKAAADLIYDTHQKLHTKA